MTSFTTRIMIAAATMVAAAGVASAQSMKAEIPFTFRAGNKVMAAGTYRISTVSMQAGPAFQISAADSNRIAVVMPVSSNSAKKSWEKNGDPVLTFECAGATCALSGVWTGSGTPAYNIPHPKMGTEASTRTAMISLHSDRAE